jgi:hypothetical protein
MMPVRDYVRDTGEDHALLARGQLEVRVDTLFFSPEGPCSHYYLLQGFKLRPLSIRDFLNSESNVFLSVPAREDRSRIDDLGEMD